MPEIEYNKNDFKPGYSSSYNIIKIEINRFLKMCNSLDDFYICKRIYQPEFFSLSKDFICPKK